MNETHLRWVQARSSFLASPKFFSFAIVFLVAGHAFDLLGTYLAQPNFEVENNVLYRWLVTNDYKPGWPEVIMAKTVFCLFFGWTLRLFLIRRRAYYPPPGANLREFLTTFFYNRSLPWMQTLYSFPRDWRPTLLFCGAVIALSGLYPLYLGYSNLAWKYGWWRMSNDYVVGISVATCAVAWLIRELWRDYHTLD